MRLAFVAVFAFSFGVLLRDVAQDAAKPNQVCERAKENADRFGRALTHLLNQQSVEVQGAHISCRVKHAEEKV